MDTLTVTGSTAAASIVAAGTLKPRAGAT
jgi:hypothetical protein